jgi:hypothetical protein
MAHGFNGSDLHALGIISGSLAGNRPLRALHALLDLFLLLNRKVRLLC